MRPTPSRAWVPVALVAFSLAIGDAGEEGPTITVPEGNGRPILIDGIFTPGEWDDALAVDLRPDLRLHLKKTAGFVFLGVEYSKTDARAFHDSVDVFISPDGTSIRQLHVGAQLGERTLNGTPGLDDDPPFDWGETSDWYGNESRWSERNVDVLMKQGQTRPEAQAQSFFRSDGYEIQIRQAKFGSNEWRLGLRTYRLADKAREFHPRGASATSTAGWFRLAWK